MKVDFKQPVNLDGQVYSGVTHLSDDFKGHWYLELLKKDGMITILEEPKEEVLEETKEEVLEETKEKRGRKPKEEE